VYTGAFFFFLSFIALASLGMLNLLTAIFVESLQELTKKGAADDQVEESAKKHLLIEFLKETFNTFDHDCSGTLDKDEVEEALVAFQSPEYARMFEAVHLDFPTLDMVLKFCDLDGDGSVEYKEFCTGIETMEDGPKKRDTWEILSTVRVHSLCRPLPCHGVAQPA
jgi:hypothetical protein